MAEVKVLFEGVHDIVNGEVHIGSTVTLVKSDKNIIVDTGAYLDKDKIISGLKKEGLTVEDIDIIVLTHLHLDHLINVHLFKNAKLYLKFNKNKIEDEHAFRGILQKVEIKDGTKLAKDVSLILTPGHTKECISVVCKTKEGTVVIAGDAIASETVMNRKLTNNDYDRSIKKILDIADYVVLGHEGMVKVDKFK